MTPAVPSAATLLKAHPVWASKRFGQHFLLDENLLRRIVRVAGPLAGRTVVEIGPGPGGLTRAILEHDPDRLIAIEADQRFEELLAPLSAAAGARLEMVWGDATRIDLAAHVGDRPACIVANLPYNVATPLMVDWIAAPWVEQFTVMVQREVAHRMVAVPGDDAYGRLAVLMALGGRAELAFDVAPGAFTPPPKVWSSIVHVVPSRPAAPELAAISEVTRAAFGQRRKMLRSSLRAVFGAQTEAVLEQSGIDPNARAETLPPKDFLTLARRISGPGRPLTATTPDH